jgi:hypothetical protein
MTTQGFPPGYFVIKSVASDRVLDITGDEVEDGTEMILWVETEKSLVESKDRLSKSLGARLNYRRLTQSQFQQPGASDDNCHDRLQKVHFRYSSLILQVHYARGRRAMQLMSRVSSILAYRTRS